MAKYLIFQWRRQVRITIGFVEVAVVLSVKARKGDTTCCFKGPELGGLDIACKLAVKVKDKVTCLATNVRDLQ